LRKRRSRKSHLMTGTSGLILICLIVVAFYARRRQSRPGRACGARQRLL
jgi:hypothetical protein